MNGESAPLQQNSRTLHCARLVIITNLLRGLAGENFIQRIAALPAAGPRSPTRLHARHPVA